MNYFHISSKPAKESSFENLTSSLTQQKEPIVVPIDAFGSEDVFERVDAMIMQMLLLQPSPRNMRGQWLQGFLKGWLTGRLTSCEKNFAWLLYRYSNVYPGGTVHVFLRRLL